MVRLARHIELELARRNMRMRDLAKKAKVSHGTMSNIMAGRAVRPRTLGRVAKALGVPVDVLYDLALSAPTEQAQPNADADSCIRESTPTSPPIGGPDIKPPSSGDE